MTGVEILSESTGGYVIYVFQLILWFLVMAAVSILLIFMVWEVFDEFLSISPTVEEWVACIIIILCGLVTVVGYIDGRIFDKPYKTYQVTISDEVSFNDFNAKYEVIKADDKIYTVRERE